MEPEHVEGLGRGRQRDVADQVRVEDEERQRGDEREPLRRHPLVHVGADDVVLEALEDELDSGLHAVGALLHAPRDVDHRHAGQDRSQEQIQHGLVDREDAEVDPRMELELVLRLVAGVLDPLPADRGDDRDRHGDVDAKADRHLALGAHDGLRSVAVI
ncbi:MAG: hypothetical protein ABR947_13825 [Solirubrobacteraceae bacterium]